MAVQLLALALPLVSTHPLALALSTATSGLTVLGITVLALIRSRELGGEAATRLWRLATGVWGVTTAAAGFALSWLLAATGSHAALFAASLVPGLLAFAIAAWPARALRVDTAGSGC